jgi:hypothetical protein
MLLSLDSLLWFQRDYSVSMHVLMPMWYSQVLYILSPSPASCVRTPSFLSLCVSGSKISGLSMVDGHYLYYCKREQRRDLVHMDTSAPSIFKILKILISHIFICLKIMRLNIYTDIYRRSVCKKSPIKNMLYFGKYEKDKFLRANSSKIIILFVINLSFLYYQKYKVFLTGLFCVHSCIYLSIYLTP